MMTIYYFLENNTKHNSEIIGFLTHHFDHSEIYFDDNDDDENTCTNTLLMIYTQLHIHIY